MKLSQEPSDVRNPLIVLLGQEGLVLFGALDHGPELMKWKNRYCLPTRSWL